MSVSVRLGRNEVAPNSPSEIAKAKPDATAMPLRISGKSTCSRIFAGDAPSRAAASRIDGGIWRNIGTSERTTKGVATIAWAMGTIHHLVRHSMGETSNVIRIPNPTVTAVPPNGKVAPMFRTRLFASPAYAIAVAQSRPRMTAISGAIAAY